MYSTEDDKEFVCTVVFRNVPETFRFEMFREFVAFVVSNDTPGFVVP